MNNRRQFLKKISLLGLIGGFAPVLIGKEKKKRVRVIYGSKDNQVYVGSSPNYMVYTFKEGTIIVDSKAVCRINFS